MLIISIIGYLLIGLLLYISGEIYDYIYHDQEIYFSQDDLKYIILTMVFWPVAVFVMLFNYFFDFTFKCLEKYTRMIAQKLKEKLRK